LIENNKDKENILTKEDFEVLFGKYKLINSEIKKVSKGMCDKIAQKCLHYYAVPKDTSENYFSDIISQNKVKIKELLEEDKGKAYNYIFDKIRAKEYLYIRRLKTKNQNEYKYKIFINIKVKKDTDKNLVLSEVMENVSPFFNIESQKLYDTGIKSKDNESTDEDKNLFKITDEEIIYKVMLYGKPTCTYKYTEDLEIEIENTVNFKVRDVLGFCKVQDIYVSVIKNFRRSLYQDISTVDLSCTDDSTVDGIDLVDKKSVFYAYLDDFDLSEVEQTVVNLTFQEYNLYKDEDLQYFKDALKQKTSKSYSGNYLRKTFLDNLCIKLANNSPFRELEVTKLS